MVIIGCYNKYLGFPNYHGFICYVLSYIDIFIYLFLFSVTVLNKIYNSIKSY